MHCSPSWLQGCGRHCVSQNAPVEISTYLWLKHTHTLDVNFHMNGHKGLQKKNLYFYCMHMTLPNAMPPRFSCIHFLNGDKVLYLLGHLTMAESRLVAVKLGILANHYVLFKCELAVLPCWLPRVVHTLLTSTRHTSHSLVIAAGLRVADRSLLGSGRSSKGWKCQ